MRSISIVIALSVAAALGACAELPLIGTISGDALAAVAGVSAVQEYVGIACDADSLYDGIVKAINQQPNATVAQIAAVVCPTASK